MKEENIVDRLMIMYGCDTQAKLAQMMNVTAACISQWRSGVTNVNYVDIIKYAVEKGYNLNWLVTGIGEKKIAFGRRNKNAQENAPSEALQNELNKQKTQTNKLIEHNEKLLDMVVALNAELQNKDKVIERKEKQINRLIEKIGQQS
ncbi:MAG: helix-turn-helix domain-containing protein [Bacteroidales bacterium]|nr:helix-turn-helix domain-containing protein [Bacteroidales bacterium]